MTTYTLAALQDRRGAALEAGDMAAYWAFDVLIGHVLGAADMYARQNIAIERCRENAGTAEVPA